MVENDLLVADSSRLAGDNIAATDNSSILVQAQELCDKLQRHLVCEETLDT